MIDATAVAPIIFHLGAFFLLFFFFFKAPNSMNSEASAAVHWIRIWMSYKSISLKGMVYLFVFSIWQ